MKIKTEFKWNTVKKRRSVQIQSNNNYCCVKIPKWCTYVVQMMYICGTNDVHMWLCSCDGSLKYLVLTIMIFTHEPCFVSFLSLMYICGICRVLARQICINITSINKISGFASKDRVNVAWAVWVFETSKDFNQIC